jgi:Flp pilus assembly protein TadG
MRMLRRTGADRRTKSLGQALPEFAIVMPLVVLMGIGSLDLGRVLLAMDTMSNAAREAARYAIVAGGSGSFQSVASANSIKAVALDKAIGAPTDTTVNVCYSLTAGVSISAASCTADQNVNRSSYDRGTPVTVVVRANVELLTPALLGINSVAISGSSTMLVNN